jgi:hypothetical protein
VDANPKKIEQPNNTLYFTYTSKKLYDQTGLGTDPNQTRYLSKEETEEFLLLIIMTSLICF